MSVNRMVASMRRDAVVLCASVPGLRHEIRDQIGYLQGVVADVINVIWAIQFDELGTRNMRRQEAASLDADGRILGSMQHQCRN